MRFVHKDPQVGIKDGNKIDQRLAIADIVSYLGIYGINCASKSLLSLRWSTGDFV